MISNKGPSDISPWVSRWASLIPQTGSVLDVACGGGRHSRFFLSQGHRVTAIDKNLEKVEDLADKAELIAADLETGEPWPLGPRQFSGVIVTNYLYRPLLGTLIDAVAPGGVLIYETFAEGNEAYGKPSRPDFLLKEGELLAHVEGKLDVIAYSHGYVDTPKPAMKQALCAKAKENGV